MEDLGNPACRKGDWVGPGGWSAINVLQTKQESLAWGIRIVNSPVVGGAPGYKFHSLPGPSKE